MKLIYAWLNSLINICCNKAKYTCCCIVPVHPCAFKLSMTSDAEKISLSIPFLLLRTDKGKQFGVINVY